MKRGSCWSDRSTIFQCADFFRPFFPALNVVYNWIRRDDNGLRAKTWTLGASCLRYTRVIYIKGLAIIMVGWWLIYQDISWNYGGNYIDISWDYGGMVVNILRDYGGPFNKAGYFLHLASGGFSPLDSHHLTLFNCQHKSKLLSHEKKTNNLTFQYWILVV